MRGRSAWQSPFSNPTDAVAGNPVSLHTDMYFLAVFGCVAGHIKRTNQDLILALELARDKGATWGLEEVVLV